MKEGSTGSPTDFERVAFLITGFIRNDLSMEQREELDEWLLRDQANVEVFAKLISDNTLETELRVFHSFDSATALATVKARINDERKGEARKFFIKAAKYAAIIVIPIALAFTWWLASGGKLPASQEPISSVEERPPATDRAVLIVGDKKYNLDSATGTISGGNGLTITNAGGELRYTGTDSNAVIHKLSVPRGGKYHLTLPDGTEVWLNAASVLSYPSGFGSTERRVSVIGEAYFKVARDKARPFRVDAGYGTIEVLGTHFNVNAYPDEPTSSVSLLEGKIAFTLKDEQLTQFIGPGQQLRFTAVETKIENLEKPDKEIAWIHNQFDFNDEPLESIMREIGRWYDLKIELHGNTAVRLTAMTERDLPASRLMEKLEKTGLVKFRIQDDTIIINP